MSEQALPHNAHAEAAFLGACLIDPTMVMPKVAAQVAGADLYVGHHRKIYEALLALWSAGTPIDFVTVCDAIGSDLREVGGAAYLNRLVDNCPTALNVQAHAEIILKNSQLRQLWKWNQETMIKILEEGANVDDLRAELVRKVLEQKEDGGVHTLFDALEGVKQQQLALAAGEPIPGIDPILPTLRRAIRFGLIPPGTLCLLGADPGAGKSMLAVMVLLGNALQGKRVAYLGTEMPLPNLGMRMAPMLAHIGSSLPGDVHQFRYEAVKNRLLGFKDGPEGAQAAAEHLEVLGNMARAWLDERQVIIMDDEHDIDRALAKLRAEELRAGKFDLVILDMVQGFSRTDESIKTEVAMDNAVSSLITQYGRRTDTVVLAISSFRKRDKGAPSIEDCRGSKQLLHDASFAGLLWKNTEESQLYNVGQEKAWDGLSFRIGKNSRFGEPGYSMEGDDIPIMIDEETALIHEVLLRAPGY